MKSECKAISSNNPFSYTTNSSFDRANKKVDI